MFYFDLIGLGMFSIGVVLIVCFLDNDKRFKEVSEALKGIEKSLNTIANKDVFDLNVLLRVKKEEDK